MLLANLIEYMLSKGSNIYILFVITAAGVVPCGSPKKVSPYIIHSADFIFFGPLRSVRMFRVSSLYVKGHDLNNVF